MDEIRYYAIPLINITEKSYLISSNDETKRKQEQARCTKMLQTKKLRQKLTYATLNDAKQVC